MQLDEQTTQEVVTRLRRVEGQVAGVVRMLEAGRDCRDVVTQLAAVSRALDRAGFALLASGLQQCVLEASQGSADAEANRAELEKLFLTLA